MNIFSIVWRYKVKNISIPKIWHWQNFYLTGLDPAGPLISKIEKNKRLDASHAVFVDAIHTDTRSIVLNIPGFRKTLFSLGTNMRMAKSDFYPNDGYDQPGCKTNFNFFGKYLLILTFIWNFIPCFESAYKLLLRKLELKFM